MKSKRPAVSPQTARTKGRAIHPGLLKRIQPDAAGIDCGATSHYVAGTRGPRPGAGA